MERLNLKFYSSWNIFTPFVKIIIIFILRAKQEFDKSEKVAKISGQGFSLAEGEDSLHSSVAVVRESPSILSGEGSRRLSTE